MKSETAEMDQTDNPDLESRDTQGYVLVRLPAGFRHDQAPQLFHSIVAAALRDSVSRVMLDVRGMEQRLTGWPGYVVGDACQVFRDHHMRLAIVAESGSLGKLRFIENVAYNRAVPLGIFRSIEAAAAWLQG